MAQRLDILIGQKLGKFVATFHGQNSGDCVEVLDAAIKSSLSRQPSLHGQ
jgi:hypothetical protein